VRRIGAAFCARLAALVLALAAATATAETWRFALIGDTPYSDYERRQLPGMLAEIAGEHVDLVIHVGDIKHSRDPCSDAVFADRLQMFSAFPGAFVLVPGDNEWADCDRVTAGHFAPEERLARLRALFYADAHSLGGKPLAVERQPGDYREHQRWRLGPVLFVTLNVPGSNNNLKAAGDPGPEASARMPQVLAWLREGFALARRERLRGIVVALHGDPGLEHFGSGFAHAAYRELLEALRAETLAFDGQVLFLHGDSHWQRIDHPLRDPANNRPLARFTRAESFGYPFFGWVKVLIDDTAPSLFRFDVHTWPAPLPLQIR